MATKPLSALGPIALAYLLVALPSMAQPETPDDPLTSPEGQAVIGRGFDPTALYDSEDLDSVNLFDGGLAVRLPIGMGYPQNAGGNFGLGLVYDSSVWDYRSVPDSHVWWCNLITNICSEAEPPRVAPCHVHSQKWPSWTSNAGLGWRLTLGELFAPGRDDYPIDEQNVVGVVLNEGDTALWRYDAPDGSSHEFMDRLHRAPGDGSLYSNDGSYLRLRCTGCQPGPQIEMPDGSTHFFEQDEHHPGAEPARAFRVRSIEDPFGNRIEVFYSSDGLEWTIEDQHDRRFHLRFAEAEHLDPPLPASTFGGRFLKEIELPGVDGPLIYRFRYGSADLSSGCGLEDEYPWGETAAWPPPPAPQRELRIALLEHVELPDLSTYDFSYVPTGGVQDCLSEGLLSSATLPTRGRVEWKWARWQMNSAVKCPSASQIPVPTPPTPPGSCGNRPNRQQSWETTAAVGERSVFQGNTLLGTWTYTHALDVAPHQDCDRPQDTRVATTTVADPLGHQKVHYFSVFTNADTDNPESQSAAQGWSRAEYGLPFTRQESQTVDGRTLFLSTETKQCYEGWPGCGDGVCELLERTYVRYEHDGKRDGSVDQDCNKPIDLTIVPEHCRNLGPILVARKTDTYDTETGQVVSSLIVDHSKYDGLGHFRRTLTDGVDYCSGLGEEGRSFCREDRVDLTEYNPGIPDLQWCDPGPGQGCNDGWGVPTTANWLWTRYDSKEARQLPVTETDGEPLGNKTVFSFDDRGFLLNQRVLAQNRYPQNCGQPPNPPCRLDPTARDLFVEYVEHPDHPGNVELERYSGGDVGPIGTTQYQIRHDYHAGVVRRSTMEDPSSSRSLLMADHTIDTDTGLPTRTVGPSGLGIDYEYDASLRLSSIHPDGEATTFIDYSPANAAPHVTVRRGSGDQETRRTVRFDGFGRVAEDEELRYDGSTSEVTRKYWAGGQLRSESVRALDNVPVATTKYTCYDPLGRLRRVKHPEGETTEHTWFGTRKRGTTTTGAARGRSGGGEVELVDRERTSLYDPWGRVWAVQEHSAGPSSSRATVYNLDLQDRILLTKTLGPGNACNDPADCVERERVYDGRGFLVEERHPELTGGSELGGDFDVLYELYDARGKPGRRRDGRSDLSYDYDFAGRLIRTSEGNRPLVELFYADWNRKADGSWAMQSPSQGEDKTAGRLFQAKRRQWLSRIPGGEGDGVTVTETYSYRGVGGRLSDYTVRSYSGSSESPGGYPSLRFAAGLAYDTFGRVSRVIYPSCSHDDSEHCPASDPGRQVRNLFEHGWLTSVRAASLPADGCDVPGSDPRCFAEKITYHSSGLPATIAHGNGVITHQPPYCFPDNPSDPVPNPCFGYPRPAKIFTTGAASGNWGSGTYRYDSLGNIYEIGLDHYLYDDVDRVVEARLASSPGPFQAQRYGYDVVGNLLSITTDEDLTPGNGNETTLNLPVDPATNRLTMAGVSYDASGNLTEAGFLNLNGPNAAEWDALGRLTAVAGTGLNRQFLYNAWGERLAVFDNDPSGCPGCPQETWTLRGPGANVLSEYTRTRQPGSDWSWTRKDYVYRGSSLLTSVEGPETRFFHLDHLGTPRLVTDQSGARRAYHLYFPFGREATERDQFEERMRFTGHERDFQTEGEISGNSERDDLDYMHARYYSPWVGRFLSVDPVLGETGVPQSWNRYAYALNSPQKYVDPDGRLWDTALDLYSYQQSQQQWVSSWNAFRANPSWRTGMAAAGAFLENAADSAALLVPVVPGGFGTTRTVLNAADAGSSGARQLDNGSSPVFSGHGSMPVDGSTTRVPEGTSLTVYTTPGGEISNTTGNLIELGRDPGFQPGAMSYLPGAEVPNLTLHPIDASWLAGNPITVDTPTNLDDLLMPNMGHCQWAACMSSTSGGH